MLLPRVNLPYSRAHAVLSFSMMLSPPFVSQPGGFKFLFVVNLQLPRSFTKNTSAASVVLYWGVPAECLGGDYLSLVLTVDPKVGRC